jgi:acyl carrier protein
MVIFGGCRGGATTMDTELEGRICNLVADQLGIDVAEVTADASILDDLGADSLDVVELVLSLEDAFDIEVSDEEVEGMRTIGDIQQYVIGHIS